MGGVGVGSHAPKGTFGALNAPKVPFGATPLARRVRLAGVSQVGWPVVDASGTHHGEEYAPRGLRGSSR
ncbi:hypothetical protein GCM10009676_27950 [Prauserella halophila]|uniref:Uncharacterized protein n=1 Tax=Prauserella halophila TaxID=185641 RepID=A0ABN1W957_9PSEU